LHVGEEEVEGAALGFSLREHVERHGTIGSDEDFRSGVAQMVEIRR
jgi:hypothetical protein